jgi:hypothetical protein
MTMTMTDPAWVVFSFLTLLLTDLGYRIGATLAKSGSFLRPKGINYVPAMSLVSPAFYTHLFVFLVIAVIARRFTSINGYLLLGLVFGSNFLLAWGTITVNRRLNRAMRAGGLYGENL